MVRDAICFILAHVTEDAFVRCRDLKVTGNCANPHLSG